MQEETADRKIQKKKIL